MKDKELKTRNFSVSIQNHLIEKLDKLIVKYRREGFNMSRSSLINKAIQKFIEDEEGGEK
jgi:metal-responsive CopG/Arc/MetJ family transcriptional regulator